MIGSQVTKYLDEEGNITKVAIKVYKNDDLVRKHTIEIGSEYIINPVNQRKTKNRDRKVIITKFIFEGKYPLRAQVKYLDNNRAGRVDIEDLDNFRRES